jgi:hypothetical protein
MSDFSVSHEQMQAWQTKGCGMGSSMCWIDAPTGCVVISTCFSLIALFLVAL